MRIKLFIASLLAVSFMFATSCKKKEEVSEDSKDVVKIEKCSEKPTQGAVSFNHTEHKKRAIAAKQNCKSCHHKGKLTETCSSAKCHKNTKGEQLMHKKCYGDCHVSAANAPKKADCVKCHGSKSQGESK